MPGRTKPRDRRRAGVTLVELVVVVSILALLLAVLLPSISRSRNVANLTMSTNTLRTLGQASLGYNTDNRALPPMAARKSSVSFERTYDVQTNFGTTGFSSADYVSFADILVGQNHYNASPILSPADGVGLTASGEAQGLLGISYAPNHFLYFQHKQDWGGSQVFETTSSTNRGRLQTYDLYGPQMREIKTPAATIMVAEVKRFTGLPTTATAGWGHWSEQIKSGEIEFDRFERRAPILFSDGRAEAVSAANQFGITDDRLSMDQWAFTKLNWNGLPQGTTLVDDGETVSHIFPHFAGWRLQPYQSTP